MTTRVSIVVPCYNVADYLDECLRSATGQSHANLQIVVVNDGSTDDTPSMVDAWADLDPRIDVVHQSNGGLGNARNRGVEAADGDFLFFLDSDDMLPFDAIERMVASANASGSDLVSGVADRFNSTQTWRSGMYKPLFGRDMLGTHISRQTDLLYDHIACSKLYRTEFWRANDFEFPEGVLFEDIELVTRAHCLARTVDLISQATYLWRDRESESLSITQDRTRPGSTAARFSALARVDAYLAAHMPGNVWDAHAAKAFGLDVPAYAALLAESGNEYRDEFVESAGALAQLVSADGVGGLSPLKQLLWRLLCDQNASAVQAVGEVLVAQKGRHPVATVRAYTRLRSVPGLSGPLVSEMRDARRRASGRTMRWVRSKVKDHGVPLLERSATTLAQVATSRAEPDGSQKDGANVQAGLRAARVAERVAVGSARRLNVASSSGKKKRSAPVGGGTPGLGLVGGLVVSVATPRDGSVEFNASAAAVPIERMLVVHDTERLTVELERSDDTFRFDLNSLQRFDRPATFRPTKWRFIGLDQSGQAWSMMHTGPVAYEVTDAPAGARYRLRSDAEGVVLLVASELPVDDRGGSAQSVIRSAYRRQAERSPAQRTVFYECFYGRSVGGHPRAIFEELSKRLPDYEHVFAVQPGFHRPPPGAQSALRWTRRYHECLQSAPIVVSNCELHPDFEKLPFQVVAQTWHGTPLKRIGLDIDSPKFRNADYQANLAKQVAQWSFMVSPTDDTDEIFPRAFGFDGPLVRSGSPRNDRVVNATPEVRARVRSALGLSEDQPAVLFAPTFRDDAHGSGGYRASPSCDLSALTASLPNGAAVLFRAHTNIRVSEVPWLDKSIINVSDYPDMQDLIVAADVLLTDYSSTMFDWALTDKPLVLFAPDLEHYQGVRDFYYDYESTMPVSIARNQEALAEQLRLAVSGQSASLAAFADRFSSRDDGAATARVVDEILARLG